MIFRSIDALVKHVGRPGRRSVRVGLCHGCFDVIHIGHVEHLSEAKNDVGTLVVSLTADEYVAKPGRPIFDVLTRAQVVAALRPVDHVVINEAPDAIDLIGLLEPDVFFKGSDYQGVGSSPQHANFTAEVEHVEKYGGVVRLTDTSLSSSTRVLQLLSDSGAPDARFRRSAHSIE
jgi:rfaE bifunctional protein nucleotidyltransferase chain/domain